MCKFNIYSSKNTLAKSPIINLLESLAINNINVKSWQKDVWGFFLEPNFFSVDVRSWKPIIHYVVLNDPENTVVEIFSLLIINYRSYFEYFHKYFCK